ncbi:MAG: hypothetical protein HQK51_17745 [Oligoflexia bacterium]|nr:hypothetical protein [Oligoflexia bacterium]
MSSNFNDQKISPFVNECKKLASLILSKHLKTNFDLLSELDIQSCYRVLKNHMNFIMVMSIHGNVLFKVMYSKSEIEDHLIKTMHDCNFSSEDLMKEYCNLFAGSLKSQIGPFFKSTLGLSFPIKLSGLDELYFPLNRPNTYYNLWKLGNSNFNVICAMELELHKTTDIDKFNDIKLIVNETNSTNIELF